MNPTSMYPELKDNRVFPTQEDGFVQIWSVELEEPVGITDTFEKYRVEAKRTGWVPFFKKSWNGK